MGEPNLRGILFAARFSLSEHSRRRDLAYSGLQLAGTTLSRIRKLLAESITNIRIGQ